MDHLLEIKDCNLSITSTGKVAESLIELKDVLYQISDSSIYYHLWGGRLRISFAHPEYHNDFARWAHFGLHDEILTERLTIIDPTEYSKYGELRKQLIDIIEERLDELDYVLWSRKEDKFHFLQSIIIVYSMGIQTSHPPDLKEIIPRLPFTSIFYHFIDARNRTPNGWDDFSVWLSGFENQFEEVIQKIKRIDPYFLSLSEIKQKLTEIFNEHL